MTDKEKRELKDGVISIFKRFNIVDHTATIGGLREDILKFINSLQEEPVSEDLEEEITKCYKSRSDLMVTRKQFGELIHRFTEWEKEQTMAKAVDATCFGFQGAALFSFRLPADNYLVGSKVKVIVIKED